MLSKEEGLVIQSENDQNTMLDVLKVELRRVARPKSGVPDC
jgi:hypothetical protein